MDSRPVFYSETFSCLYTEFIRLANILIDALIVIICIISRKFMRNYNALSNFQYLFL